MGVLLRAGASGSFFMPKLPPFARLFFQYNRIQTAYLSAAPSSAKGGKMGPLWLGLLFWACHA
jgi:hypothetical protein